MRLRHGGRRAGWRSVALALVVALLAANCGDDGGESSSDSEGTETQDFSGRGPHLVGATRTEIDTDRPVEVFYPAAGDAAPADARGYRVTPEEAWGRFLDLVPEGVVSDIEVRDAWFDLPASTDGPFPLVVVSHGFGVERFTHTDLAAHLASWGFVVALPEHPSRDFLALMGGEVDIESWGGDAPTILDTIDLLEEENVRTGSPVAGLVDSERVGVVGHSGGGHDAVDAAYDDRVDAWVGLAPAVPFPETATGAVEAERADGFDPGEFDLEAYLAETPPPEKPSMMILADNDLRLGLPDRRLMFDWLEAPKRLALLDDTGHSVFLIGCDAIQEEGGSAVAEAVGFDESSIERQTFENGCLPDDAPVADVQATFDHLTVAHLRESLGIDAGVATASLEAEYLEATFPDRLEEYVAEVG
jgi:dienelactone hydrolase